MPDMVPLTIYVNKEVANDAVKKHFLEIATRQKDARFKQFFKCAISQSGSSSDVKDVLNTALSVKNRAVSSIEQVNHAVRSVNSSIASLSNNVMNMSSNVDAIFKSVKAINALSFLNVGLSMVNMSVSITGFAMLSAQLTQVDNQLQDINHKLDAIKLMGKNKIVQDFHHLAMDYNSLFDALSLDNDVSLEKMEDLLKDTNAYLGKIIQNIKGNTLDAADLLNIIYALIVPYTAILNSFITYYYELNQKMPNNYETFISLYETLLDNDFIELQARYWFLEQNKTNRETFELMDAVMLLTIENYVEIKDQTEMLQILKTKEKVDAYHAAVDESIKDEVKELAPEVAILLNKNPDICQQILQNAIA